MTKKINENKESDLYPDPVTRQLLHHLPIGLLFVNSTGMITQASGPHLEVILGEICDNLQGATVESVFEKLNATLSDGRPLLFAQRFESASKLSDSGTDPVEISNFETLIKLHKSGEAPVWVRLSFISMSDSSKKSSGLMILEDHSQLMDAKEKVSNKVKDENHLIQKVLVLHRMNSAQIEVFFLNLKGLMESVELNLVKKKPFHFYRTIHAIAGIAQSANLKKLKNIAVNLEQLLLLESENAWNSERFISLIEKLKSEYRSLFSLQKVLSKNIDKISIDFENLTMEQMIKNQETARIQLSNYFTRFQAETDQIKQEDIISAFQEKIHTIQESLSKIPIEILESGIKFRIKSLTENLDKVIDIQFRWESIFITRTLSYPLCEVLLHLVTNSIQHGIESPKDRMNAKKTGHGTITISVTEYPDTYRVKVEDDGAGIDPEQIRNRAKSLHIFPSIALESMTSGQLYQLLCKSEVSLNPVSEFGNEIGSGLELAQDNVRKMGGSLLAISSTPGKNCVISFKILKNFGS